MNLFNSYLQSEIENCVEKGVRLSFIGRRDRLNPALFTSDRSAESRTIWGNNLHLRIAIDYSARDAILAAAVKAAGQYDLTGMNSQNYSTITLRIANHPRMSICSSGPAANNGSAISCCGNVPMPNCTSPTSCGLTLLSIICDRLCKNFTAASAVLDEFRWPKRSDNHST